MTRRKKESALRSAVVLLVCSAVLTFVLKDYLIAIVEGWEINHQTPMKVRDWFLWAIGLRETP